MGVIGPNHFVELINGSMTVFDRSGSKLGRISLDTFLTVVLNGTTYPRNGSSDPHLIYDRRSGRWFASALETGPDPNGKDNHIILAVSRTSDPTKVWDKYVIPVGVPDAGTVTYFTDYDTLGLDDNGVYWGMTIVPSDASPVYAKLAATPKASLLAASPSLGTVTQFSNITDMLSSPQPAHNQDAVSASSPAWFVSSSATVYANVVYRTLTWSGGVPALTASTSITTTAFSAPRDAPASGSTTNVDVGDDRLLMAVIRNNRLWTCRNVGLNRNGGASNPNRTGCGWMELSLSGTSASLRQEGFVYDTAQSGPTYYYYPAVMVSGQGHVALGFSGSSSSQYISAYTCGRLAGDTLGTMGAVAQLQAGLASYTLKYSGALNRWGDYSYTSLDPNDDMTFWTIQEYAGTPANNWSTWIARLRAPAPTLNATTASGARGAHVALNLTGTGFYDGGTGYSGRLGIKLSGSGIWNYAATFTDSGDASVAFDISVTAAAGARDIILANPDGQTATLAGAFTVTSGTASLSLGNQVWNDANANGVLDGGEAGIDGVVLNLYEDSNQNGIYDPSLDTLVASTTTSGGGLYTFSNLIQGSYTVLIPPSNFVSGAPLYGFHSSTGVSPVPDPNNNVDNDNNGYTLPGLGVASKALVFTADNTALDIGLTHFAQQPLAISGVTASGTSVQKYHKVELVVSLANAAGTQYYDWDSGQGGVDLEAAFTSPFGRQWQINGFYDGADASWKVRFAPDTVGMWSYTVSARDAGGTVVWNGAGNTFTCTPSNDPGHLSISGNYLRFKEGQPFFGVGHNTGWQPDVEYPPLATMQASGENLLAFWLNMPWAQPAWASASEPFWSTRAPIENIEQGIGNYNQAACAYIDGVVDRAEQYGIYLLPSIWAHDQLTDNLPTGANSAWSNNPYKTLGITATDFYKTSNGSTDTPQWRYQKNFYRYLLARWGYSRAIAGWMAVAEIDNTNGYYYNATQAEAWCGSVRTYFAGADPFRTNASGQYPIVAMKSDETSTGAAAWDVGLNLRAVDSYLKKTDNIGIASTIASETATMRGSGKPALHTEFGGYMPDASQPLHLHNGIWAGTAAGACMTPLSWGDDEYYSNHYPMVSPGMAQHLQYLGQFMQGLSYLGDPGLTAVATPGGGLTISGTSSGDYRGWGMRQADRGFVWIQRYLNGSTGIGGGVGESETVQLTGLASGTYTVEWYDVWVSGAAPQSVVIANVTGGSFSPALALPALPSKQADIAMKFVRAAVWQGGTSGAPTAWNEPANWSTGTVPGTSDTALIPTYPKSGYFPVIDVAPLHALDHLEVQNGATLTINDGLALSVQGNTNAPLLSGTGAVVCNGSGTLEAAPNADRTVFQHSMTVGNLKLNASAGTCNLTVPAGVAVSAAQVFVASGVLIVNGALYSSASTTVAAGMTLTGTGTAGNIVAGGTVSPGNGVGRLQAASADFSAGGTLRLEIANGSGSGFDQLILSGGLALGGASTLLLDLNGLTTTTTANGVVVYSGGVPATGFTAITLVNNPNNYAATLTYIATALNVSIGTGLHITAREALDTNGNGHIDAIRMVTDAPLNDNFAGLQISVGNYEVIKCDTGVGANDNEFFVRLSEGSAPDTDAVPGVKVLAAGSLAVPNSTASLPVDSSAVTPADKAKPVLMSASWGGGSGGGVSPNDPIYLTFSEPVTSNNALPADFGLPVTNDSFGDSASVSNGKNQQDPNMLTITLGGTPPGEPRLTPGGTYSSSTTTPGSPTGIYVNLGDRIADLAAAPNTALNQTIGTAVDLQPGTESVSLSWDTLSVTPRDWAIGTSIIGAVHRAYSAFPPGGLVVRNSGNVREKFTVSCSGASPNGQAPYVWALASTAAQDQFEMKAADSGPPYSAYTLDLAAEPQDIVRQLYSGHSKGFDVQLALPAFVTSGAGVSQTITVTITATKD